MPEADRPSTSQRRVLTVTALTRQIKNLLEGEFAAVTVSGEVSDVTKPRSGHVYFTLKDKHSQIRGVVWRSTAERLNFDIRNGQQVVCHGNLDVYPARGSYQLVAQRIEPVGLGDWQMRLRQLYRTLKAAGYFDPAKKKSLPSFVRHLVLVTSPTGAAVRDFLEVARRRWSNVRITIAPVRVQGEAAGLEIANMVRRIQRMLPAPDVIVVTRGGGSVEDLWCFNDEALVKAVHDSVIPIVSAVGHEVDVSLCDLAADVRALTPSEAAELSLPSSDDIQHRLENLQQRLSVALRNKAADAKRRLLRVAERRVLRQPLAGILQRQRHLDELHQRAARAITRRVKHARQQLAATAAHFESLSPLGILARGYAVALDSDGNLAPDARGLSAGDALRIRFRDGDAKATVTEIILDEDKNK